MKVTTTEAWVESFELTRPYTIAFKTFDSVQNVMVKIQGERGRVGLGAAAPIPEVTGETLEACQGYLVDGQLDWLIGKEVRELPALCRENHRRTAAIPAAGAAVDMALYDLLAQELEVPLVEMLGRAHQSLPTSITIGIKSVSETVAEAQEYLGRGFRILKVKLGRSLQEDLERLRALRNRFGKEVGIRVDVNQGYSRRQLYEFLSGTRDLGIELLEQPLPANDVDGMRKVAEDVRQRLAADESLLTDHDALALVSPPRACGIFNIKLMKCGGIHTALRIATVAELAGVELMWGCMDESRISITAALHAALACPATRYLDLDGSFDLGRDIVEGGFILENGLLRTAEKPGLGVQLLE